MVILKFLFYKPLVLANEKGAGVCCGRTHWLRGILGNMCMPQILWIGKQEGSRGHCWLYILAQGHSEAEVYALQPRNWQTSRGQR